MNYKTDRRELFVSTGTPTSVFLFWSDFLLGCDLDGLLLLGFRLCRLCLAEFEVVGLLKNFVEHDIDIEACLGRGLDEIDAVAVRHLLPFFRRHLTLVQHIALVPNEYDRNTGLRGIRINALGPLPHTFEGFFVDLRKYHDDSVRLLVHLVGE